MKNQKILILGVSGMLGNAVFRYLSDKPELTVYGTLRSANACKYFPTALQPNLIHPIDVLNQDELIRVLSLTKPDVVINCVGLIKQLSNAEDPLSALPINSILPHRLAELTGLIQARLIHISTDCVFSGKKGNYHEDDFCDAYDLYGISKKIGEVNNCSHAITIRTSIIGHELNSAYSLIGWFLAQQNEIKGYKRVVYSGLPTVELAQVIHEHILPNPQLHGLYHVASEPIDKYTLLSLVAEIYSKKISIIQDEQIIMDKSLNASRFKEATGYIAPNWPELITKMQRFG